MKFRFTLFAIALALGCGALREAAQGPLTPPGPPGPTMPSLSQIEPRTPIPGGALSAPYTITTPGSYYLTGNITVSSGDAIDIEASGVTLDLNGFTISSTASPCSGTAICLDATPQNIYIQPQPPTDVPIENLNIQIKNGNISGSGSPTASGFSGGGFLYGISSVGVEAGYTSFPANVLVTGISVSGCEDDGINLFVFATVDFCAVFSVGGNGIFAGTVLNSSATAVGDGIDAGTAMDCVGSSIGGGTGISANSCAENCYGSSNSGTGLNGTIAENSRGVNQNGDDDGLDVSLAINCYGYANGDDNGISTYIAEACYGTSIGGGTGLYAQGSAENCQGSSNDGTGLYASTSENSTGVNIDSDGDGLDATLAINCQGFGLTGLRAINANFCFGSSVVVTGNKYNMP